MTWMDLELATYLLFFGAFAAGALGASHVRTLGDLLPPPLAWAARVNFGLCLFLAIWGLSAYGLWTSGISLKIGSIANGRIGEAWWLGPAAGVFAMASYSWLRESTSAKRTWTFSNTAGGVVIWLMAAIALLYGLDRLPAPRAGSNGPATVKMGE